MAYNILKGSVEGSVDQHADQEIGGVKVFRNTVSASVFWDTDAQSPCATMKDVAVKQINGRTKNSVLIYEDDNTIKTDYSFTHTNGVLKVNKVEALNFAGSAKELTELPVDQFSRQIDADNLNYSNGLHDVRGTLQVKGSECIQVDEDGVKLKIDNNSGLWIKSKKLIIDASKADKINNHGQNLSDNDLLLVTDVSEDVTKSTTLKNFYEGYLNLKVPQASGNRGFVQIKGTRDFDSSPKLTYDIGEDTLNVDGRLVSKNVHINKKLVCEGAVFQNIIKTSNPEYKVQDDDYTILCDSSNNKIKVLLPPPCNSEGRMLIIKKSNSDRYKLNSNVVEIHCSESKIDLSDSVILKSNYSARTLQSDGNTWLVINKIG